MNRWTERTLQRVVLLLLGAVLLAGCQGQSDSQIQTRLQDLLDSPSDHIGETVSVSGEVNEVFTPRSFTIGGSGFGRQLLIVSTEPITPVEGRTEEIPAVEDDIVQVIGVVQRFDSTKFAQEYNLNLQQDVASEYQGEPVVVALQGSSAMHNILVSPRLSTGTPGAVTSLSVATDTSQQAELQRRIAALPNARIQEVVQEGIFWIGSGKNQRLLAALNPESTPGLQGQNAPSSGEEWRLYGVFRSLPPAGILRTDWGLSDKQISALEDQDVYLNVISAEPASGSSSAN